MICFIRIFLRPILDRCTYNNQRIPKRWRGVKESEFWEFSKFGVCSKLANLPQKYWLLVWTFSLSNQHKIYLTLTTSFPSSLYYDMFILVLLGLTKQVNTNCITVEFVVIQGQKLWHQPSFKYIYNITLIYIIPFPSFPY